MNTTLRSAAISTLCALYIAGLASADEASESAPKVLEVNKLTPKLEVRQSQIGYRSTLLFYTFNEQKTVLKLQIGNKDTTFPVTATVYIFENDVTEDGLKKWLNNQHSDGLFPDVPEPSKTLKLPATVCKVTSHKLLGQSQQPFGKYDDYAVSFEVKEYSDMKSIKLKAFSGETKVHVKTN